MLKYKSRIREYNFYLAVDLRYTQQRKKIEIRIRREREEMFESTSLLLLGVITQLSITRESETIFLQSLSGGTWKEQEKTL